MQVFFEKKNAKFFCFKVAVLQTFILGQKKIYKLFCFLA